MNALERCEQISILLNSSQSADPVSVICPEYVQLGCAESQDDPIISPEPSESENVWVTFAYGFVAVTIINLSSIGGLMIVPLMNKRAYHRGSFSFTYLKISSNNP